MHGRKDIVCYSTRVGFCARNFLASAETSRFLKRDFQSGSHSMSRMGSRCSSPLKVHLQLSMAAESAKNELYGKFAIGIHNRYAFQKILSRKLRQFKKWELKIQIFSPNSRSPSWGRRERENPLNAQKYVNKSCSELFKLFFWTNCPGPNLSLKTWNIKKTDFLAVTTKNNKKSHISAGFRTFSQLQTRYSQTRFFSQKNKKSPKLWKMTSQISSTRFVS